MNKLTTVLELVSVLGLVLFAWFVWPPAAIGVGSVAGLLYSRALAPRRTIGGDE